MRRLIYLMPVIIALILVASCVKTNSTPAKPSNPIQGLWIGTQLSGTATADSLYYSLDIRADSSLILSSQLPDGTMMYASGPWTLTGTTFFATVTGLNTQTKSFVQRIQGSYDKGIGWLLGGWVNADNSSGTFTTYRVL